MIGRGRARAISVSAACGAAASIAVLAAAPAAVAAVSHPKAGSYAQSKNNQFEMEFTLSSGHVKDPIHYTNCVRVPIEGISIKVSQGKFSFDGKRTDVIGQTWKVHVDGKFVSRTTATGNWSAKKLTGGHCTNTFAYKATWQQSPTR